MVARMVEICEIADEGSTRTSALKHVFSLQLFMEVEN